tara:strand:- start:6613 stop:7125 length:513 start_codon:yes stop_codon:yes gene_type:complete
MTTSERKKLFHQSIAEMKDFILRIAATHEQDPDLRKDLVQDIALAVWQALPGFRGDANVKTFVGRVAINRCLAHASQHARVPKKEILSQDLATSAPCPETSIQVKLTTERLHQAVAQLPTSLREPTVLMLEGYKTGEIAEIMGLSPGATSVRLNRARPLLAQLMEKKDVP